MTKTTKMLTTTLLVNLPIDYSILKDHYKIERYVIPSKFVHMAGHSKYAKLHMQSKQQLGVPYHFFSHDKVDGRKNVVIYALYAQQKEPKKLTLAFLQSDPLESNQIAFSSLESHCLFKLLLANYFHDYNGSRFIAEKSQFYVFAKQRGNTSICLEVKVNGDRTNPQKTENHIFQVSGQATSFIPCKEDEKLQDWQLWIYPRYKRLIRENQVLFMQVHPEEVNECKEQLYKVFRSSNRRTTLDFHDQRFIDQSRGKLLHDFTFNFINYLGELGIVASHRQREFREHKTKIEGNLKIVNMNRLNVFDNRINKETIPLSDFIEALRNQYPELQIDGMSNLEEADSFPLLLLQDGDAADFLDDGILARMNDPYKNINSNLSYDNIPKQSININPNDATESNDLEDYLEYENEIDSPFYQMKLDVCIHQLFLKFLVLKNEKVFGKLPGLKDASSPLSTYIFIRRQRRENITFTIALYIRNGVLSFLDLRSPEDKTTLYSLLDTIGINWDEVLEIVAERNFKNDSDDLARFDLVIGKGFALEIEDINERVIYAYDRIESRLQDAAEQRPIEEFKLSEHYDTIKNANMYSISQLQDPKLKNERKRSNSERLLHQLKEYDDLLDELAETHIEISYNDLIQGDLLENIGRIFNLTRNKPKDGQEDILPKFRHNKLKGYYRKRGMLLSPKSKDVMLYQGIWYDDNFCYLVGDPQSMKDKQDKGSVIRRFSVVVGDLNETIVCQLLDTLAVQFVRNKRYTVHSYFFYLINLFMDGFSKYLIDEQLS